MNIGRTIFLVLVVLATFFHVATVCAQSENSQKSDKRARAKQTRKILKGAVKNFEKRDYQTALVQLDSVIALIVSNPDGYYYKGLIQTRLGDTSAAIETLARGVSQAPMSSRIKLLLARLYIDAGRVDDAFLLIGRVLAIKPREGEALYLRGLVEMHKGDTSSATVTFNQALDLALSKGKK